MTRDACRIEFNFAIERRAFVQGAGLSALAFTIGGAEVMLTPRQARAKRVPLRTLTVEDGAALKGGIQVRSSEIKQNQGPQPAKQDQPKALAATANA